MPIAPCEYFDEQFHDVYNWYTIITFFVIACCVFLAYFQGVNANYLWRCLACGGCYPRANNRSFRVSVFRLKGHNECSANVKLALNSRAAPYRTERLSTKQTLNLKTTVYKTWHYLLRLQPDRAVPGIHLSVIDAGSAQFYG